MPTKAQLQKENESLKYRLMKDYQITDQGNPSHIHELTSWELVSDQGIAYCDFKCPCGFTVSQLLGERITPKNIPTDKHRWREN